MGMLSSKAWIIFLASLDWISTFSRISLSVLAIQVLMYLSIILDILIWLGCVVGVECDLLEEGKHSDSELLEFFCWFLVIWAYKCFFFFLKLVSFEWGFLFLYYFFPWGFDCVIDCVWMIGFISGAFRVPRVCVSSLASFLCYVSQALHAEEIDVCLVV